MKWCGSILDDSWYEIMHRREYCNETSAEQALRDSTYSTYLSSSSHLCTYFAQPHRAAFGGAHPAPWHQAKLEVASNQPGDVMKLSPSLPAERYPAELNMEFGFTET